MRELVDTSCQKRQTICTLYDKDGNIVSRASNHCEPDGVCPRLGIVTNKANYLPTNTCNTEHAEVRALKYATGVPVKAVLEGHRFYCDDCERLLRSYGIKLEIKGVYK